MTKFSTPQEEFWAGSFGDEYIARNQPEEWLATNTHLLSTALRRTGGISSAIEFGANIGINLLALRRLFPLVDLTAMEINAQAVAQLRKIDRLNVFHCSILDPYTGPNYDLSFISGVLIHVNPDHLVKVYDNLYQASRRLILVSEYYNPTPVELPYRGHAGRLFKRDFAGEMLKRFPNLRLIDYGFHYRQDPTFPGDDLTWFLLEKR